MKLADDQHNDRKDSRVGLRVELPAFSDQWMRGARFGVVVSVIKTDHVQGCPRIGDILCVRCDHPQVRRLYRHHCENFRFI